MKNFKAFYRTISARQASNSQGREAQFIKGHFEEAYTVVNELLEKASIIIRTELEEEM